MAENFARSRGPKHYCSQLGSLQIAQRIALRARKNSCRQGTPEHRAGIEVQPVAAKIRDTVGLWRMPMNDQTAVIARVGKKWLPDPNEIVVALGAERFVRIDAGMDKKTLTVIVTERKRAQPGDMLVPGGGARR